MLKSLQFCSFISLVIKQNFVHANFKYRGGDMGGYGRPLPMASRAGQQQAASERKSGRAISLSDRVRNGKGSERNNAYLQIGVEGSVDVVVSPKID